MLSIEKQILQRYFDAISNLAIDFEKLEIKTIDVERPDRFIALGTGLLEQSAPGMFILPFEVHTWSRRRGVGGDCGGERLDRAYAEIFAYSHSKSALIAPVVGCVRETEQRQQDENFDVNVLTFKLYIIIKQPGE